MDIPAVDATPPLIRLSIATSLDGFIAARDGAVTWLDDYNAADLKFDDFLATIDTVVMGRATYDQVISFGVPWPYEGKRCVVLTNRPIDSPPIPPGVETGSGDVRPLARRLGAAGGQDVWICGGARVVHDFLDAGVVDRIELAVVPILLGDGVPLFRRSDRVHRLKLTGEPRTYSNGIVTLTYSLAADPPPANPSAERGDGRTSSL